ncbi:MAG: putative selenate reductase subunit YgfK [Cellulosilyticaceae bacterium]
MNDRMTPIPFNNLMNWILSEKGGIFGIRRPFKTKGDKFINLFNEKMEIPFGPAAGPHTQLAQNIVASYVGGARFFEVKTVQTLDGEDLCVAKPCITAGDECYNVEWSTELTVEEAFNEYAKAWFALKLISKELELGDENGFMFNMSVGYDFEGIRSPKIDTYINSLKDATNTAVWAECKAWAIDNINLFKKIDKEYIENISPVISTSITLSTLHGCPPAEIERIAVHLITNKKLNTYIKCNPTLLGYEFARETLDKMGYDYIVFDDHHFKNDLQFEDAVPMITRLMELAKSNSVAFGVKLTNTFPVQIAAGELPGEEMYMSGRSLFPLTISLAARLARTFDGNLRVSFSGGADSYNIDKLFNTGIYPITLATTLLKPGGYQRLSQLAEKLIACDYTHKERLDVEAIEQLAHDVVTNTHYLKPVKPLPNRKTDKKVPLTDCTFAPCHEGCPIHQDIPEYVRLVGEGKYLEALNVIVDKNPLPFITGTICSHRCMDKCRRNFYDESVAIRDTKLLAAKQAFDTLMDSLPTPAIVSSKKVAIIGGGPAGISAAYFLARSGMNVTIFEKRQSLGGIVRHVIPEFRIATSAIENDAKLMAKLGVDVNLGAEVTDFEALKQQGYDYVVVAVGAWKHGNLRLQEGTVTNVLDFLENFRANSGALNLGKDVVIIGGGNTAMDAARAAKRVAGVENVSLVYRRNKRNMPADEEELALALTDGVEFRELLSPVALKNGKLTCEKMILGAADASGRRSPVATGEFVEIAANTVIAAVGESIEDELFKANNITLTERNKVVCDTNTLEIASNIFIAGDVVNGPATVVEAIRDARIATDEILKREEIAYVAYNAATTSVDAKAIYEKKGILTTSCEDTHECDRCLNCSQVCECCVDVCPNRANLAIAVNNSIQILHVDRMCNECGNCAIFCPYNSSPYKEKFTVFHTRKEFETSSNQGFFMIDQASKAFVIRLDDQVSETTLDAFNDDAKIKDLITAVLENYSYIF